MFTPVVARFFKSFLQFICDAKPLPNVLGHTSRILDVINAARPDLAVQHRHFARQRLQLPFNRYNRFAKALCTG